MSKAHAQVGGVQGSTSEPRRRHGKKKASKPSPVKNKRRAEAPRSRDKSTKKHKFELGERELRELETAHSLREPSQSAAQPPNCEHCGLDLTAHTSAESSAHRRDCCMFGECVAPGCGKWIVRRRGLRRHQKKQHPKQCFQTARWERRRHSDGVVTATGTWLGMDQINGKPMPSPVAGAKRKPIKTETRPKSSKKRRVG